MHAGPRRMRKLILATKNHIAVDNKHKLIRNYAVTSAEIHDSNVCTEILANNSSKDVWADSAYRSEEQEMELDAMGYRSHIHRKGKRNKPLNERTRQSQSR